MPDSIVLVDTDVWSCTILTQRDKDPRVASWRTLLLGMDVVVAAQTEAELRYGAILSSWGERRLRALEEALARTPTLPVAGAVIAAYARLRAECHATGHPLHAKEHMGDAWVAATAIAHDLPLLAGDQIYLAAPGLRRVEGPDGTPLGL